MTPAERNAAIAGARANVAQKHGRYHEARRAFDHACAMLDAALCEYADLIGERHTAAPPASTPGDPWCAGNPVLRTEELL